MTNLEFVKRIKDVLNYKTLYVMGCFGAPMTDSNKKRYTQNHSYNKQSSRTNMINNATEDTFGFDCVNLIKGILWSWVGDKTKIYGGAKYASNGVPDISANQMITVCKDAKTNDWDSIEAGEVVWMDGHIGVYVGDGQVVESTPKWSNNVQLSYLGNIPEYRKGNYRIWTKHGHLPYIDYVKEDTKKEEDTVITVYNKLEELPTWAVEDIKWLIDNNYLRGDSNGNLSLSYDMVRMCVLMSRLHKGG